MSKVSPRRLIIGLVAAVMLIFSCCVCGVAAWPMEVGCGAPGMACMPAPDPQGYVSIYYEVEPLGVMAVETVLRVNLPGYYSGYRTEKIQ